MGLAMVPLRRVAAGFPQLVREVVSSSGKDVRLEVHGEDVELDSRVLDAVADALRHLVTNAVDHGCELPRAAGSPPARPAVDRHGRRPRRRVDRRDRGLGRRRRHRRGRPARGSHLPRRAPRRLDGARQALLGVLFSPGFSTRAEVTETSGRGVGLDVVQTVVDDVSGTVEIRSTPGAGTGLHDHAARHPRRAALPHGPRRRREVRAARPRRRRDREPQRRRGAPGGRSRGAARHGEAVPLMHLGAVVGALGQSTPRAAIVVRYGAAGEQLAWAVDALEGELELVVKELGPFLGRLPAVSGATVDGDGSVVLVLDLRDLAVLQLASGAPPPMPASAPAQPSHRCPSRDGAHRRLRAGARAGRRGLRRRTRAAAGDPRGRRLRRHHRGGRPGRGARLAGPPADLVLSDVEMPGMDGFTLTRTLRRTPSWANVPVVIMTSRGGEADRAPDWMQVLTPTCSRGSSTSTNY
jgi:CheY-like chemotaxis protein